MKSKHSIVATLMVISGLLIFSRCTKNSLGNPAQKAATVVAADQPVLNFTPDLSKDKRVSSPEHPISKSSADSRQALASMALRSAGCGGSFSGSWSTTGYHQYVQDSIKLDSVAIGATISLSVSSYDVPNRFTVTNGTTGSLVAASSWMGYTTNSGPWGMSLNTAETGTLTFTRGSSSLYLLLVETVVNSDSDSYSVSISCN